MPKPYDLSQELKKVLNKDAHRTDTNLKHQQEYYKRLLKEGVAEKQTYNLKPVASMF